MADNIAVTPGAGVTVATDDVAGVQHQRVKIEWGADGVANDVNTTTPLPIQGAELGTVADAAYSGSGNGSMIALLKKLVAQFTAGFTMSGSVSMADAEGVKGQFGGVTANPSQTFTRPADTTAYAANDLVANSTTAGSVAFGTVTAARVAAGALQVDRVRLNTNHTTGLSGTNIRVRLWTAAPTYTNGDNGAYAVATGAAGYLGSYTGAFEQFADGAAAMMLPDNGAPCVKLASGQVLYWDVQTLDAFTPQSGKTFTLALEAKQD